MKQFKVEITQGSVVRSRIIKAESIDIVLQMISGVGNVFPPIRGLGHVTINIAEVDEYLVTWVEHNVCSVFASDEESALDEATHFAENNDTCGDTDQYVVSKLEPDEPTPPEIEVSRDLAQQYITATSKSDDGVYAEL